MASNVTRDHHRWTRDITTARNTEIDVTGNLTLDASGDIILSADGDQVIMGDGTTARFTFNLDSTPQLDITGAFKLVSDGDVELESTGVIALDASGDIVLSADGDQIKMDDGTTTRFTFNVDSTPEIDVTGNFTLDCSAAMAIETASDFELDSEGSITLDSATGEFEMHGAGTTAKFADMYAGMILGYTVIGLDATPASYTVTNAMDVTHDDHKVSFVFPPSGKVEIMANIYVDTNAGYPLTFGLSTASKTAGIASLGAKYENSTYRGGGTDGEQHTHRWYVIGTAGDAEELWFSAGTTRTGGRYTLRWGGDSSPVADESEPYEYQPFVMKAIALPSAIYDGT